MQVSSDLSIATALHHRRFIIQLQALALILAASSALYLVAANWWQLPQFVQILIPQSILLFAAGASLWVRPTWLKQALQAICVLMLGLSLATLGQVYQTGADSYLLFLLWSLLILPWLYRYNLAIYLQFCIVSHLALILFFQQTYYFNDYAGFAAILVALLGLIQFVFALKYAEKISYVFVVWFTGLALYAGIRLTQLNPSWLFWLVLIIPNLATLASFYYRQKSLGMILAAMGLLGGLIYYLLAIIFPKVSETFALSFAALLIFVVFATLGYWILRLSNNQRLSLLPLVLGAWLSSLFLALLILVAWHEVSLLAAVLFMFAGLFVRHQSGIFVRQMGYSLFIAGQLAFLIHLFFYSKVIWASTLSQIFIMILLVVLLKRLHWLFAFLQLLLLYGLIFLSLLFDVELWGEFSFLSMLLLMTINYFCFATLFFLQRNWLVHYQRSFVLLVLIIILGYFLYSYLPTFQLPTVFILTFIPDILTLIWFVVFFYLFLYKKVAMEVFVAMSLLAGLLWYLGHFHLFLLFMLLAWTWQVKDRLLYYSCLVVFFVLLWQLYYQLNIGFLWKAASILFSACAVWGVSQILLRNTWMEGQS